MHTTQSVNKKMKRARRSTLISLLVSLLPGVFLIINIQTVQARQGVVAPPENAASCILSPVIVPVLPDKIPGYTELDPDTQLHVTGTAQVIDLAGYALEISGNVKQPVMLKYDDLRCLSRTEARLTLVCPGFFEDTATWAGASLKEVLELAGIEDGASHIRLVSADGYATLVSMTEAFADNNFLAYEFEGLPIPILHGFPVRAVFPDLNGNKWVKWLVSIEVQ